MVVTMDQFAKLRDTELKDRKVVCTSGYFDPIHPGHISCIRESKKFGEVLVVVVNGDMQCVTKKGKPFISAKDRAYVVDSLKDVDYVVLYDHPERLDSCEAIASIRPDVFTKGGDRDAKANVPEVDIVESNGGRVEYNVGDPKVWSSSDYLKDWVEFSKVKEG